MPVETPILPVKGKKNILITSALPYVNNVPHLGNVVGSVLSADVFSRFSKLRNRPTLYICGTDEYGTATETKALETGQTPQQLCDEFHKKHKEVYDWFEIGFDYFGRTTTEKQTEIVQDIFLKLHKNGLLEERTTTQPYCEKHDGYLADRFVEGTCPKCSYDDARGDQCDKCGGLLDPFELIKPRCKVDGAQPVPRDTKHIFLKLNELQPSIEEWFEDAHKKYGWPANGTAITKSWLTKGLEGRSITRDLKWGVPIPLPGYEKKVIYVWFDACIGYPSITANYTDEWEKWWKNPEDVSLYQFMGKDNVPFHTVIFPGSEIGTGEKWTMLNHLSTTEYLNYENGKFSKSRGVGVFGNQVRDIGISPSVWRYYLLSNRPETADTQFEWQAFVLSNNSELLANFGNFVNRIVKFVNAKCDSTVPDFSASYTDDTFDFPAWIARVNTLLAEYVDELEKVHIRAGVRKLMEISTEGNALLQYRLDNANLVEHPERTNTVIGLALNLCHLLASLASPYMPSTSESICKQLNTSLAHIPDVWTPEVLKSGHKIGKAAYLFTRIDDKKVTEWKAQFGGSAESRAAEEAAKKKKQEEKEKKKAKKAKKAAEAAAAAATAAQAAPDETGSAENGAAVTAAETSPAEAGSDEKAAEILPADVESAPKVVENGVKETPLRGPRTKDDFFKDLVIRLKKPTDQ
ncbi:putative methionine--tRNA ligase, cytoplasmic protein rar1 [Claviceps sp. LM77 group G4]|nr:putative methionine--tRNA ligase, cytoplasmic protein rar1 [Claviceps sp. LM77 group G4]KAG6069714.1 putative methionine--tRNA ligase, cytoplasmic protein rar1 [Claviceps sp. LM78 group G4]KAG6073111.1 putative methionine--tRNA ligase, cytoplasmic protein rar1 [Claviceps sp. LM84 group G4]